jgi:hypothetical protein
MQRIFLGISKTLLALGLALMVFAAILPVWLGQNQYRSLGTLGPYSFLAHRGGVLVSRRILVWREVKLVPVAAGLLMAGAVGIVVIRKRSK